MSEKLEITPQVMVGELQARVQFLENRVLVLAQVAHNLDQELSQYRELEAIRNAPIEVVGSE